MEVLTILDVLGAVISAAITNAVVQRRLIAAGHGWARSTMISGVVGFCAAIGIIAAYFSIGHLIWRLSEWIAT